MSDDIDRAELRRLDAAAAPGPWSADADAAFIAAARTAVPALLDALEQTEAERESMSVALRLAEVSEEVQTEERHSNAVALAQAVRRADQAEARIQAALRRAQRAELERDEWQAYVIDAYRDRDKARRERDMAAHMRKEMRAERDRAMARADAKAAQTAYWQGLVDAVRELHQHGGAMSDEALEDHTPVCTSCLEEWPCPTIEALDGAP